MLPSQAEDWEHTAIVESVDVSEANRLSLMVGGPANHADKVTTSSQEAEYEEKSSNSV